MNPDEKELLIICALLLGQSVGRGYAGPETNAVLKRLDELLIKMGIDHTPPSW